MTIDNKISFIAGWFLTTATTITAVGILKAAVLGLVGGFFGLFGKEMYFYVKAEVNSLKPKVKAWVHIQIEKLKMR
jgi:hypothetical protein